MKMRESKSCHAGHRFTYCAAFAAVLLMMTENRIAVAADNGFHPKGYVCHRVTRPPRIDGRLDDEAWREAAWTDDFVDIQGDARPRPRFRTRGKMVWDDEYFYIGAELEEPHVWGTLTERDSIIFHDNDFEVFIDPDSDNHLYYELEINALGTVWDLLLVKPYIADGPAVHGWDIRGLRTAVHIDGTINDARDTDRGWSVEIAIPWPALRECAGRRTAPPADGDQWRVNFSRVQWLHEIRDGRYVKVADTKEDNWVWSPQGVIDMHRPWQWGYVQFSTQAPGTVAFRPDSLLPARHWLHLICAAQRERKLAGRRYAERLEELDLAVPANPVFAGPPQLRTTFSGFEAMVELKPGGRRVYIREDWRCWAD